MKNAPLVAVMALSVLLSACNNEPEETPNLEEAMPLDFADDAGPATSSDAASSDADQNTEGSAASSGSGEGSESTSTMQSGSNADGGRKADPSRTKLLPAD